MHALLQQFMKPERRCMVPHLHKENEADLGEWVGDNQGQLKRKEGINPDRQIMVKEMDFEWMSS
jgi:hypothetical protein